MNSNPERPSVDRSSNERDAILAQSRALRARHLAAHAYARSRTDRFSIAVAAGSIAIKAAGAFTTGSIAVLGTAADSVIDLLRVVIVRRVSDAALTDADEDHRFGHGKVEAMAALGLVALATMVALGLGAVALYRIHDRVAPSRPIWGLVALSASTIVSIAYYVQNHRDRAMPGAMRRGIAAKFCNVLLVDGAAIVALLFCPLFGACMADGVAGMAIAVWILAKGVATSRAAIDQLMDHEWPEAERQRFLDIVARDPDARGMHDFRTRSSGTRYFAQLHLALDPTLSVEQARAIVRRIKESVGRDYSNVEFFIHVDPEGQIDHPHDALVESDVTPGWVRPPFTDR